MFHSIKSNRIPIAIAAATAIILPLAFYYQKDLKSLLTRKEATHDSSEKNRETINSSHRKFTILFATSTGTAKAFAHRILQSLLRAGVSGSSIVIKNVQDYDVDSLPKEDIVTFPKSPYYIITPDVI